MNAKMCVSISIIYSDLQIKSQCGIAPDQCFSEDWHFCSDIACDQTVTST